MSNQTGDSSGQSGPRRSGAIACVGCFAVILLSMLAVILIVAIASRGGGLWPKAFQGLTDVQTCRENLEELSAALRRYHNRNDAYPEALEDLYPDYLNSEQVLVCPGAPSKNQKVNYRYLQPKPSATPSTAAIRCFNHKPASGVQLILEVALDGEVRTQRRIEGQKPKPTKKGSSNRT